MGKRAGTTAAEAEAAAVETRVVQLNYKHATGSRREWASGFFLPGLGKGLELFCEGQGPVCRICFGPSAACWGTILAKQLYLN